MAGGINFLQFLAKLPSERSEGITHPKYHYKNLSKHVYSSVYIHTWTHISVYTYIHIYIFSLKHTLEVFIFKYLTKK